MTKRQLLLVFLTLREAAVVQRILHDIATADPEMGYALARHERSAVQRVVRKLSEAQ